MYIEIIMIIILSIMCFSLIAAGILLCNQLDIRDKHIKNLEDKISHLKIRCKALQCDNKYYENKLLKLNKRRYNYGCKKRNSFTRKNTNSY